LKLHQFALLTDENIHPRVVASLRTRGFDVLDVQEQGLVGSEDALLLQLACSQNRVILTHDADSGAMAVSGLKPLVGIVFLRPGHIDPEFTLGSLQALLNRNLDLFPPFVVVAKRTGHSVTIRVRNLGPDRR